MLSSTAYMHCLSTTVLCGRYCHHHFVHKATETQTQSLSDSRTQVGSLELVPGLPLNRNTALVRSLKLSEARCPSKKFCLESKWNYTPHIALLCRSHEIAWKSFPALHQRHANNRYLLCLLVIAGKEAWHHEYLQSQDLLLLDIR